MRRRSMFDNVLWARGQGRNRAVGQLNFVTHRLVLLVCVLQVTLWPRAMSSKYSHDHVYVRVQVVRGIDPNGIHDIYNLKTIAALSYNVGALCVLVGTEFLYFTLKVTPQPLTECGRHDANSAGCLQGADVPSPDQAVPNILHCNRPATNHGADIMDFAI